MAKTYEEFVGVHGILLAASGLPSKLYPALHHKLVSELLDGGSFFAIEPCEDGRQRRLILSCEKLEKESDVFLVDHAWSFRLADARKQLEEVDGLAERMARLMCVASELQPEETEKLNVEELLNDMERKAKAEGKEVLWLELDDMNIEKLQKLDLAARFPNLVAISLWGNRLQSVELLLETITCLRSLRGLWLNGNPVSSDTKLLNFGLENLEIYNSKLVGDFGTWGVQFCCGLAGPENPLGNADLLKELTEVDFSNRDIRKLPTKGFNHLELPRLASLNLRGNSLEDTSSLDLIAFLKSFESLKFLEVDIPGPFGDSAIKIIEELPKLEKLNCVSVEKILTDGKGFADANLKPRFPTLSPDDPTVDRVLKAMWRYVCTYRLADEEKLDETPIWYVMDELGSAVRHSDEPNMVVAPFMFLPDGTVNSAISYSLMWPVKNIFAGEECTRDYLAGIGEDKQRSARLTAWFYTPRDYFHKAYIMHRVVDRPKFTKQLGDFPGTKSVVRDNGGPLSLTVYSDLPQVCEFLTRPEFVLTEDPSKADILWPSWQIDSEACRMLGLQPHQYVNQFPFEACLVMKHHLAETVRQAHGSPVWLPVTYNLEAQLAALIGDYNAREERGEDNTWIIKPWNMARTMDTTITRDLPAIVRHLETGPKICQKYIEKPALFHRKKFDMRYVVLLRSLQPLELFLFDIFWVRLAFNDYITDDSSLFTYETHFTVNNYRSRLNHTDTHTFVPEFEKEHNVKWRDIHERVKEMLWSLFEGAALVHPEMHSNRARAIYGVDIMLDSEFQPKLLEVTYCPDCTRACKYDVRNVFSGNVVRGSDFFNSVFGCCFLGEDNNFTPLYI